MIRRFETRDLGSVMELWLKGNVETHSFIKPAFWYANLQTVQASITSTEVYRKRSTNFVLHHHG